VIGRSALGIDISDGALKAVLLTRRGRRITLQRTWAMPLQDKPSAGIVAAARLLRSVRPGNRTRVILSAPTAGLFSRNYLVPAMDAARIEELVRYEVLADTGQAEDELIIRHHVRKGVEDCQAHVFALPASTVNGFRARLSKERVSYDDLEVPGFALASFVELEMPSGRDRVLLGVGKRASELVLQTEAGLWMRHLPLGLEHDTPDALAARFRQEIGAAVAHLLPDDRDYQPNECVLTEEGVCDAAFTSALKRELGIPVVRVAALERIHASWRLRHEGQGRVAALSSAKAFGLALCGLGTARYRCPVVAGDPRREAMRRVPMVATGVIAASLALIGVGELSAHWTKTLDAVLPATSADDMAARVDQGRALSRQLDQQRTRGGLLAALAQRRPAAFQPRRALGVLAVLTAERGESRLHLETLWLASTEPDRPALMTLTLHADPELDAVLAEPLAEAFGEEFGDVRVRGPEPAPMAGLSRWVVELEPQ
jgi:hypothetical protein